MPNGETDSCLCLCHVGSLPCNSCFERSCSVAAPLLNYKGIIYVRPVGRGVCLVDLEGWPEFEDLLPEERFYEATIVVTKEVPKPEGR